MSERIKLITAAASYIGCNEADGTHKKIIDIYNAHTPLARGYKVKYTDAWCATFVSAVAIECGMTDIIPTECGCGKMIDLFKQLGEWQENDAHVPKPGDVIFYDWDDTGSGDNTGGSDHVGIVESVRGSTITVIEGNKGTPGAVAYRTLSVNGRYIRGYGLPKFKDAPATDPVKDLAFKVGDEVQFTGAKHYTSANATGGSACKEGKAKVTAVSATGKHPYHLIGSSVYGWVDEDDVKALTTGGTAAKLTVDGIWGPATTKRLQQIFGTPVDGVVSNQLRKFKASNPGLGSGWEWLTNPLDVGSALIKAMQKWAGMAAKEQDGMIGTETIKALQKKLGTPVDGTVSNPSQMVKALQKWANEQ